MNENHEQSIGVQTQVVPEQWSTFMSPEPPRRTDGAPLSYSEVVNLQTPDYLSHINSVVTRISSSEYYLDKTTGLISQRAWKELIDSGAMASSFGDREPSMRHEEIMQTGRILSFHDINLGLSVGITTGLVIMPLQRFGSETQQDHYLGKVREGARYGLAITELNKSGSTAFDMESNYVLNDQGDVTVQFGKHLQGMSGQDGLIVAARKAEAARSTIGLVIVDQEDISTQKTEMAGLSAIPYGINTGVATLEQEQQLLTELSGRGFFDFQDMFTKSRLLFSGMTLGHLERAEFNANSFANERRIGEEFQANMPFPKHKLEEIRARRVVTEAIFNRIKNHRIDGESLVDGDTRRLVTEADIAKTLTSEYAFMAAMTRAELQGGKAFYADEGLQDAMNIWPFQIFEGSRWMLYTQIGHTILKKGALHSPMPTPDKLFDLYSAGQNLDEDTREQADIVFSTTATIDSPEDRTVSEEILGEIASRCFALSCLDIDALPQEDYLKARKLLNLEIKKSILDFSSLLGQ